MGSRAPPSRLPFLGEFLGGCRTILEAYGRGEGRGNDAGGRGFRALRRLESNNNCCADNVVHESNIYWPTVREVVRVRVDLE